MSACASSGANAVELHTGSYSNARSETAVATELIKLRRAASAAAAAGLKVYAGHGLNYLYTGLESKC